SIPVRTRSRSGLSARPLLSAGTPVTGFLVFAGNPLSHAESLRLNSFILSEGLDAVNFSASLLTWRRPLPAVRSRVALVKLPPVLDYAGSDVSVGADERS